MAGNAVKKDEEDYSLLKDVKLEIKSGSFTLCFWLYLIDSTSCPSTLLAQVHPDITASVPFLVLNERKDLMLFPLLFLHLEAPSPGKSISWTEFPHTSAKISFPLKKWIHVACEVSLDFVRIHIDGVVNGERLLTSLLNADSQLETVKRIYLVGRGRTDDGSLCYVHNVKFLSLASSIKGHHVKEPPPELSIDSSSAVDIEEDSDGTWSIVGGKPSCRRNFSLDVVLLDAFGQPVNKDMKVVASLLYADNNAPVEKPSDADSPLLISYDGLEFASHDRPSKLINGRAAFKLKISQLSSKCDNRLFCIRFNILTASRYPFLEAFSRPIRCISRNRITRASSVTWKSPISATRSVNGSQSSGLGYDPSELLQNIVREARPSPSSKRVKLGQENPFGTCNNDLMSERAEEECNSQAWIRNKDDSGNGTSFEGGPETNGETDHSSDSGSSEATNSMPCIVNPVPDIMVFKYCLGNLTERSIMLKEISLSVSQKELVDFADRVSLYSGCSHHWRQIVMAKRLIEEGTKAWNMMSHDKHHVMWENLVSEMRQLFLKITSYCTRSLGHQDIELLRTIAACQDLVAQEHFEKMWCWLYPVAFTLSQNWINAVWNSSSPKWIEGLITKEEAESSLQGPGGLKEPGTFVLRFPTSRSWPHPDAGSLIVTYVSSDYNIRNRLLSLDSIYSFGDKEVNLKPLQDMLLEEPELCRLGRVSRGYSRS